ncbi:MAG: hypothetical protein HQK53_14225 [Oligoflexia bacterium]|nr:hypothetical protein [Oligoflexia bacterium]
MRALILISILILIPILFTGNMGHIEAGDKPLLQQALLLLHKNQISEGYALLDKISETDKDFIPALLETQRIHYKQQEWEKFFGYANFYRLNLLEKKEQWASNFSGEMLSLEALALIRFCYWEEASAIVARGLEIGKEISSPGVKWVDKTQYFISALKAHPKLESTDKKLNISGTAFSKKLYWPVNSNTLKNIHHPRVVRFKMTARCGE